MIYYQTSFTFFFCFRLSINSRSYFILFLYFIHFQSLLHFIFKLIVEDDFLKYCTYFLILNFLHKINLQDNLLIILNTFGIIF